MLPAPSSSRGNQSLPSALSQFPLTSSPGAASKPLKNRKGMWNCWGQFQSKETRFYSNYRFSYTLSSTVSPDEVITYFFLIRIFSLHSILYIYIRFLVFLNQCMMPSPQHTLFELPTHLVKLQFSL